MSAFRPTTVWHKVGVPKPDNFDELMGRTPGAGWQEFGALLRVRCIQRDCSCQPDSTWRGGTWLHGVNECQVRTPDDDVEVELDA